MLDPLLGYAENLDRYTELRSHANLHTRLVMRKGAIIENAQSEKRGVSARCYRGGPFGFASRVGDGDRAIEAVVDDQSRGFGDFEDRFESVDWMFEAVDRLCEELREKADGACCEAGTHDVILDSDLAGILAHEAIGHTCEADLVLGGSVAGDNLGRQVASEKFTLVDHAGRGPDGNASIAIHVDDNSTPCRDVTIIENGVLRGR